MIKCKDIVKIKNYLGVIFDNDIKAHYPYDTYCKCKDAERNTFKVLETIDIDYMDVTYEYAVVKALTAAEPFNLLVHRSVLVQV